VSGRGQCSRWAIRRSQWVTDRVGADDLVEGDLLLGPLQRLDGDHFAFAVTHGPASRRSVGTTKPPTWAQQAGGLDRPAAQIGHGRVGDVAERTELGLRSEEQAPAEAVGGPDPLGVGAGEAGVDLGPARQVVVDPIRRDPIGLRRPQSFPVS
jgi:hypothetical protein